jgi:Tfp pilus assembly protein PilF
VGEETYHLYEQGLRQLADGDPRAAAETLERAVEQEPAKASLHETLGRAYFASSRVQPARAEFERAVQIDPTNAYAHFGMGRCYERQGRLVDAAKHYKIACALTDDPAYQAALDRVQRRLNA